LGVFIGWRWQGLVTAGPLCGGGVARAAMTLSVSVVFGIRREIVRSNNREVQIAYRGFGYCGTALLELFFENEQVLRKYLYLKLWNCTYVQPWMKDLSVHGSCEKTNMRLKVMQDLK
jgi:hypothetical protein